MPNTLNGIVGRELKKKRNYMTYPIRALKRPPTVKGLLAKTHRKDRRKNDKKQKMGGLEMAGTSRILFTSRAKQFSHGPVGILALECSRLLGGSTRTADGV